MGATWVAPYSPRARAGAPVSTPIEWSELTPRLDPLRFDVRSVPGRLERRDPWARMESVKQTITAAILRAVSEDRGAA